ncbi:hypothetical protein TREMEDRAFT_66465 [Tremella mesenterica DSM 1558]|uniref:uncharacterized protein n=1 Tax=Tremella mesenterica (strain ATCC 24925 / CBS 8224 / DSM 1558 / NBRC 9311 / NRRL Y-6157 / RJB 2259-6 / UBC 559-6) TaxID=578456 RepID=UPI00032CAC8F|nr:uncharacterized protein TREMEDRAFT_66465 [Tremella mesenterica DSM 1558]EIW65552.1 hypothetical protein TREMEDRAFT_66465 [Tremella mesenterica DSM 1558]
MTSPNIPIPPFLVPFYKAKFDCYADGGIPYPPSHADVAMACRVATRLSNRSELDRPEIVTASATLFQTLLNARNAADASDRTAQPVPLAGMDLAAVLAAFQHVLRQSLAPLEASCRVPGIVWIPDSPEQYNIPPKELGDDAHKDRRNLDAKLSTGITELDAKLSTKITELDTKLCGKMTDLQGQMQDGLSRVNQRLDQNRAELGVIRRDVARVEGVVTASKGTVEHLAAVQKQRDAQALNARRLTDGENLVPVPSLVSSGTHPSRYVRQLFFSPPHKSYLLTASMTSDVTPAAFMAGVDGNFDVSLAEHFAAVTATACPAGISASQNTHPLASVSIVRGLSAANVTGWTKWYGCQGP